MPQILTLGQGRFTWPRGERITDRYGAIGFEKGEEIGFAHGDMLAKVEGQHGTLKARVITTRRSHHIGDLRRGLFPQRPIEGQEFALGTGTFRQEQGEDIRVLTCVPDDGRQTDWYDPEVLYTLHDQDVLLWVEVT